MTEPIRPLLLKVTDPIRDTAGVMWYPIAGWALDGDGESPPIGYPWQLEATLRLGVMLARRSEWEYLALTCHLVTGLHDRYEHTFDSWNRKGEEERHQWMELMVPEKHFVHEAAQALGTDVDTADQFLLYRTLFSRLPVSQLRWFASETIRFEMRQHLSALLPAYHNAQGSPAYWRERYRQLETWADGVIVDPTWSQLFEDAWTQSAARAAVALESEYAAAFRFPTPCVPFCRVTPDCTVTLLTDALPVSHEPTARLLDYALTANLLRWDELLEVGVSGHGLILRPNALSRLRGAMEEADPTRRIGTANGGRNSDESLRLLLQARLMNLIAPMPLWEKLGVAPNAASSGGTDDWRLPIPAAMRIP